MAKPFEGKDKIAHSVTDTDLNWSSPHHTLGEGPTQAARGNHKHTLEEITDYDPTKVDPRYVLTTDCGGALNNVSLSVPTNVNGLYHMNVVSGNTMTWGTGVILSGSGIQANVTGWYRLTFAGGFVSTVGGGTIRLLSLGIYPALGIGTNTNHIAATSSFTNTGGVGAICSASGVWYLTAGDIVVLTARHDYTTALTATAGFTLERIQGVN